MNPNPESIRPAVADDEVVSPLQILMRGDVRALRTAALPSHPDASHSIVIGELIELPEGRLPRVRWSDGPRDGVEAMSVVPLASEHVGAPLALSLGAGLSQPLILGLLWQPGQPDRATTSPDSVPASASTTSLQVERDGGLAEEVVIGALEQLTLHCGEASITLTADGQILLRGEYISSHATGTQRIKGAAVRIN